MEATVEIRTGRLRGERVDGIAVFRGIPYAAPPVGELRFRPPAPPVAWAGVRSALEYGCDAPQPPSPMEQIEGEPQPQSEDCLTLNVWAPEAPGPHPVMVWIHGGGFTTGSASRPLYDGAALARRGGVVVVSLNYRLGILGLLTHPGLTDPATGLCGGWGLLDQIAALEWVQGDIAAFGGDPDAVTVFGESAGGASVALLCSAPRARGLFRRAIVQSASPQPLAFEHALEASEWLLAELGLEAEHAAALRDTKVDRFLGATPGWSVPAARDRTAPRPAHGAPLLPYWPEEAVAAGLTQEIELLVGSNRDEAKLFAIADPRRGSLDAAGLLRRLSRRLRGGEERARHVIDVYERARKERGEPTEPWELWCAIETDRLIRVPAMRFLEQHTSRGGRGRAYLVTWESPVSALGACHAVELPFCFGTLHTAPGIHAFAGSGPGADRLMEQMQDAWLAFGAGRDPGGPALGPWRTYDADRRTTMVFGAESGAQETPREPERRVWEERELSAGRSGR